MRDLPEADLYVCTGDMLDNFPVVERDGALVMHRIDRAHEVAMQTEWCKQFVANGGFKRFMGSPDAHIVCVRGNHDFIPLAEMFRGCNVTEFVDGEMHEIAGMRIVGHRGIPYIYGTWNDEVQRPDLLDRVRAFPTADLFLTHYPPAGVLDSEVYGRKVVSYGLDGMAHVINNKMGDRGAHCFGHIHGSGGQVIDSRKSDGDEQLVTIFSNAACTFNSFDL